MKNNKNSIFAYVLILPSFIFLAVFTIYPIIKTFFLSFFRQSTAYKSAGFAGFYNYKIMFEDEIFQKVIFNNFVYSLIVVSVSMALGLMLACVLNKNIFGRSLLRTAFFYPVMVPMIAAGNIWLYIYTPTYGILDRFLSVFGFQNVNVLGSKSTVLLAVIIVAVWKETGYLMIFFLAGLQNMPKEVIEAAKIDGAENITIFSKITLPLLKPTTIFVFTIALTDSFRTADHIMMMTQGGPDNASNLLLYHIYETAFHFWNQSMASTLTVIMIVIMMAVTFIRFFTSDKKIYYS